MEIPMSATAEAVTEATKKAVKKTPAKKAAPKKTKATGTAAAKPRAKKLIAAKKAVKKAAPKKVAADAPKRGRPPGKKAAKKTGVRRGKKGAKQFAYLLMTAQEDGTQKAGGMQGPFITEAGALEDASIMADDNTTIVLFRETKRGKVQKQTKFVAGR
jgi:hypothetical protein